MMTKPSVELKKVDLPVHELFINYDQLNLTKTSSQKTESDDIESSINEQDNILYEKVKPSKQETLDIEAIIAQYNMTNPKNHQHTQKKEKPKILIKKSKQNPNKICSVPNKMIASQDSILLMNEFKKILDQKFNNLMNELNKERKSCLERLFNYLCFGFQQILDSLKSDTSSMSILASINKDDILMLLKQRCFAIDLEILRTHKSKKRNQPTLKFKSQWKLILDFVKDHKNSKLREAIIIDEVQPSLLVYARQIDLIKYLSPERQNKLKYEAEEILRNSQTAKDWIAHPDNQNEESVQEESQTSITAHQSVQQADTSIQKEKKVQINQLSKNKKREIELTDIKSVKKMKKQ